MNAREPRSDPPRLEWIVLATVIVSLSGCTCGTRPGGGDDDCTPGTTRCNADAVETCRQGDGGDYEWGAPIPCQPTESCSLGVCGSVANCVDECSTATITACSGNSTVVCGEFDSDTCLDLGMPVPCGAGETCSNGACGMECADECTTAMTECVGVGANRSCGELDQDTCTDWGPPVGCAPMQACNFTTGLCQASKCSDDCDPATFTGMCGSGGFDACVIDGDADPCYDATFLSCDVCTGTMPPVQCAKCCPS